MNVNLQKTLIFPSSGYCIIAPRFPKQIYHNNFVYLVNKATYVYYIRGVFLLL
jgi:hypothetical protein